MQGMVSKKSFEMSPVFNFDNMDFSDLPASVIVCDLPNDLFNNSEIKMAFESIYSELSPQNFVYFPNFRRARVDFASPANAANARILFHDYNFKNRVLKIYFAQQVDSEVEPSLRLEPPEPEKMFLISPPASPPVGWKPVVEASPVIGNDFISSLAALQPETTHEIHPGSDDTPRILLHTSEEMVFKPGVRQKIKQTMRPAFHQQ